jgi:DNA-binding LytR/AlgR family response regulator
MEIGPGLAPMEFSEDMPPPEPYKQLMKAENQENDLSFLLNLAIALLVTGTGTAYKVIFLWITEEKRRKTLEDNIQTPGLPEEENIFVKSDYKTVKIKINDILYVESANEYIKIYLEDGDSVTTFMRLKNFETMLPQNRFMRVQRSFIINLSKIKAVEKNRIFIDSKRFVPIGEQYKEAFQQFLGKNFFQ